MSRTAAAKQWHGKDVARKLEQQGVFIRSASMRGLAEEAPGAYKDVSEVVEVSHQLGLATKVAKLVPLICVKG
jgi:tRNA-splicing ligase RtcB